MSIQSMCSGEAALVPAGLRGYRMWNLSGLALRATSYQEPWGLDGTLTARCRGASRLGRLWLDDVEIGTVAEHEVPSPSCQCGIYGWYRPDESRLHHGEVFGVFEATGRVLLGDFGFRAEHGRVLAIVSDDEMVTGYWQERGVSVFRDRGSLIEQFPAEDVTDLLGHPIPDTPPAPNWAVQMQGFIQIGISTRQAMQAFQAAQKRLAEASRAYSRNLDELILRGMLDPSVRPHLTAHSQPDNRSAFERAMDAKRNATHGPRPPRRGRARLDGPQR